MSERCPLEIGELTRGKIPTFCLQHCAEKWDDAMHNQVGIEDSYENHENTGDEQDACRHVNHNVDLSHEALYKLNESSRREYVLVDECAGCQTELREKSYIFDCPYE
jgi:hypothetical protein